MTDWDQLQLYVRGRDAQAFEALARRYLNVVYSMCYRQLRDAHLAEDATQAVFLLLARRARTLKRGTVLSGWLFQAARYCCCAAVRAQRRRDRHEREAALMRLTEDAQHAGSAVEAEAAWRQIAPHLENALSRLCAADRDALLVRYYEQRSVREVGVALGISEDAAKMRLSRARSRLRDVLGRLGPQLDDATLAAALPAAGLMQAPASLQAMLPTLLPLVHAHSAPTAAYALCKGAMRMIFWTKVKLTAAAAVIVVATGVGTGAVVAQTGGGNEAAVAQERSGPATSRAPLTIPAPATRPLVDLSTPLEALKSFQRAAAAADLQAVEQCTLFPDSDWGIYQRAAGKAEVSQGRLLAAVIQRFGPRAKVTRFSNPSTAEMAAWMLEGATEKDVKIDGDTAAIHVRVPQEHLRGLPGLDAWAETDVRAARVNGLWKIDLAHTIRTRFLNARRQEIQDVDLGELAAAMNALANDINGITDQIGAGQYRTVTQVDRDVVAAIQAFGTRLPPGVVDMSSIPFGK